MERLGREKRGKKKPTKIEERPKSSHRLFESLGTFYGDSLGTIQTVRRMGGGQKSEPKRERKRGGEQDAQQSNTVLVYWLS